MTQARAERRRRAFRQTVSTVWCIAVISSGTSRVLGEPIRCANCHAPQAGEFADSVHAALACGDCHGGEVSYELDPSEIERYAGEAASDRPPFDHGTSFRGKPSRAAVPDACGECHADVERMNPYGLRTDQLARYWTSGHGKTLKQKGDDRVAVCTDCHGVHAIQPGHRPGSRTHPFNVPDMCGSCHANAELMGDYDLPVEVVAEYRQSVHGVLLLQQQDSGAPTCATCHGNHSAMPPGFASVGTVCGQCHHHVTDHFEKSVHAGQEFHKGCVQCHGGGEGRHYHLIEEITKPPGVLIERYAHLLATQLDPTPEQITSAIHARPREIMSRALPTCTECHDEPGEDESLPKLFSLLDRIDEAERYYVRTANRIEKVGQGVLLVDNQRFKFEDAKTHLIGLAPLQHTLDNDKVAAAVAALHAVCDEVNAELDTMQRGLELRYQALLPMWALAILLSVAWYIKFKRLKHAWVKPPQEEPSA